MKILIMGAGGQGGPCASILARDNDVAEIRLADIDISMAEKVKHKIGSPKIKIMKVNATHIEEVAKAAKGVDIVIDLVMPWMATYVMEGALKAKANYVNTAYDTPYWDQLPKGEPLALNKEFKKANLTALLGCGMAPGFLNIIVKLYCDKLDKVESIKLRLGKKKLGGEKYDDITAPWNPGWAPSQALIDCAMNPLVFRDGKYEELGPYSEIEEWEFPDPIGKLLVSHHSHEEPYSLPFNIGKGIKYCDFKYYVSYHPAALVSLGLTSDKEIDVKGVKVKPLDVVTSVLPKAGNAFLDEDSEKLDYADEHSFVSMVIQITGEKDGNKKTYNIHCPKMTAPGKVLYKLFGTSLINVALPAVIGAKMTLEGAQKGVIFAEQLDPKRFIKLFKATGNPYQWEEL